MSGALRRPPGRATTAALAVLALGATGVVAAQAAAPPPAHKAGTVGLKQVGPIDEANGFPLWYKDTNDVRLELCLDPGDPFCIMGDVPNPQQPVSFPGNFPDEAFWAAAESPIDAGGGETGILVTAVEAAFGSADGLPAPKQQISFGRVRIRVAGVVDGATYRVTHPFGTDTIVAEPGAVKGLNVTEDVGNLVWDGVFDQTLAARTGPFLRWDPAVAPAAPNGYLGDVTVEHSVVGSPYDTNFFRVEGPAGSFTGSTMLCADERLGDDPVATDDCIENDQFLVQGKLATRAGVQVTKAVYRTVTDGTGDSYIDVFARSEAGQTLIVSGTGVSQTQLRGTGDGQYFARVRVAGAPPSDLKVTNTSDKPNTVDHVESALFGDKVHITAAKYDITNTAGTLTVTAESGDPAATLTLAGYPAATKSTSSSGTTFTATGLAVPPDEVVVTSNKGGVDSDDVVITGNDLPSAQVIAALSVDTDDVTVGQTVTLDGTASQGTISSAAWSISPATGATLSGTNQLSRTFSATATGQYVVTLTVTGPGANNTSTATATINVSTAQTPPVANAGPDQQNVVPTSLVTLDGSASQFTATYLWTQTAGTAVTLNGATTANPTFTVPRTTTPATLTFQLKATGANTQLTSTDTVTVLTKPDALTVDAASYKRGGTEWRVRGTALYCSANNTVTVTWNKPGSAPVVLGTATPALDLGVCSWDFRLKNTPAALRPTAAGTVTVTSALGGDSGSVQFLFL